jgi:hypothetical protein
LIAHLKRYIPSTDEIIECGNDAVKPSIGLFHEKVKCLSSPYHEALLTKPQGKCAIGMPQVATILS